MGTITVDTTLEELAALVSQALEQAGILAILSGGAAVSLYSDNEYESSDLDFVSSEQLKAIGDAIAPLGFRRRGKARHFEHPDTHWYLEFPPGPVAFGATSIATEEIPVLETAYGPLRVVTPTQIIMDRLAAYAAWNDNPSWDQAIMVASHHRVDWPALRDWAAHEGVDAALIDSLQSQAD
jgi:hypothetical protein